MSALAMILTAAMMVPGDGPEKASGEIARERQPLDLSGEWEGTLQDATTPKGGIKMKAKMLAEDFYYSKEPDLRFYRGLAEVYDEGAGRMRFEPEAGKILGIYQQDGDRVIMCIGDANGNRPDSFRIGKGQQLLILHRVKSRK
jgi:hypothetical protein